MVLYEGGPHGMVGLLVPDIADQRQQYYSSVLDAFLHFEQELSRDGAAPVFATIDAEFGNHFCTDST